MSEDVVLAEPDGTLGRAYCGACKRPIQVRIGPFFIDDDGDRAIDVAPMTRALAFHHRYGCSR